LRLAAVAQERILQQQPFDASLLVWSLNQRR